MKKIITPKSEKFLEAYLNNASPAGFETSGQQMWLDYIKPYIDEYYTDVYGSAVGIINPEAKYKVVIEAHADEISWFVNYISAEGLIYVKRNGGSDHQIAPSMRVNIHTKKGIVKGVFGWPAIHVRDAAKEESPSLKNLFIDNSEIPTSSVMNYTNTSGAAQNTGAEGTLKTLRIPLFAAAPYSASNQSVHVVMGQADLRAVTSASLSYFYAYSDGVQSGGAPSVVTSYSEDCGTTWQTLNTTPCVSTGTAAVGYFYVPVSGDYKPVTVDLNSLKGKSVLLRISGKASNDGNTLYLDQISLKSSGGSGGGGGGCVGAGRGPRGGGWAQSGAGAGSGGERAAGERVCAGDGCAGDRDAVTDQGPRTNV